jgi:competence protein ComEC
MNTWSKAQRPVWALLCWTAGIALQLQQAELLPWPVYVCTALAGGLCCAWLRRWPNACWLGLGALSWGLTGLHALVMPAPMPAALEGRDLEVVARVQSMVQRQDGGMRMRVRIEHAEWAGQTVQVPEQVYLGWYAASAREGPQGLGLPAVLPGERWRWRVRLKAAHGHLNPGGFDYELWLWEQGIRATGYVRQGPGDPPPQRLGQSGAHPIEWARQRVRDAIVGRADAGDAAALQRAGVVAALVTGDQAAIERSDWDVFRATGVAHLMSISGLHVTMLAWLAQRSLAWLWRRSALWGWRGPLHWPASRVGALGGLAVAWGYALFAGWGVPAQRTVWMLAVVIWLRGSARQWPATVVWSLALALVLTLDPWAALQPGFWLSFVAVGVLWASSAWSGAPKQGEGTGVVHAGLHRDGELLAWHRRLAAAAWGLWREQWVLSLALAPLGCLFFAQVSLVGLLANVLAVPWVTLLITPLALAGVLWPALWDAAAWALAPLSVLLGWLAAWPGASWSWAMPPWPWAVLATLGMVLCLMPWPWAWRLWGLAWCLPILCWTPPRPAPGQFELLAADVGQGNAVLVRTARHTLLYDAGPRYSPESDAGHRVLVPWLSRTQEPLDRLMLSHRDIDHTGGAPAVLAMRPQAQLWSSLEAEHPLWTGRAGTRCQAGQSWVWDGVHFEVLHPRAEAYNAPAKPNALSCVLRIDGGGVSALLAGDIEAAQERALLAQGLAPVDWLLVPHHGSRTSSSEAFVQALQPRIALVQAGYRNRFGHPVAEVAQRYTTQGVRWVETVRCGAASWHSAQPGEIECQRAQGRRYWHHRLPP